MPRLYLGLPLRFHLKSMVGLPGLSVRRPLRPLSPVALVTIGAYRGLWGALELEGSPRGGSYSAHESTTCEPKEPKMA